MQIFDVIDGLAMWRQAGSGQPVLYVHGSTFPIALSVGYRFDGASWADSLAAGGFDVWGLDFAGHGESRDAASAAADEQVESAIEYILKTTGYEQVLILAHSWGSIPAGMVACRRPERVGALALFGPIAQREGPPAVVLSEDRLITVDDQYVRFTADVPEGADAVLSVTHFTEWAPAWLATDPDSAVRRPAAVRVPFGAYNDLATAWSGKLGYDPAALACPTLVVRGARDSVCDARDVVWFRSRVAPQLFCEATVPEGTHLLHLEQGRQQLYAACTQFFHQSLKGIR